MCKYTCIADRISLLRVASKMDSSAAVREKKFASMGRYDAVS